MSPSSEKRRDMMVDVAKASRNVKSPGGLNKKENYNIKTTGSIKNRVRAGIGGSMVFPPTMQLCSPTIRNKTPPP